MKYRRFGKTDWMVSEISLGTWQVGGKWGSGFDDKLAESIINEAIDHGVNFIDTADVYENYQSEAAVSRVVRSRSEEVYVATKCGRFLDPHNNESYTPEALTEFVEKSLRNTGFETLDLIQLHCPPTEVYYRPEIFETFDRLKEQGKIRHLGVSVEKVEEALKAIEYPNVVSVQIIFNIFRQRPAELFFKRAKELEKAILVRVPLASGLLSGKFGKDTVFEKEDHRNFNRDGAAFDRGETFAGVPYEKGLEAVAELEKVLPSPLAESALRWILGFDAVSTIIPGASRVSQVAANIAASGAGFLSAEQQSAATGVYEKTIKGLVHQIW
jgi:aryl-alcohol dehydrogenase-like predicted oxidoreductase